MPSSHPNRHAPVPPHGAGIHPLDASFDDPPRRETPEDLFEADTAFETGQGRADAEMDAITEREVIGHDPVNVETVGVRKLTLVTPGTAGEQQHLRSLVECRPMDIHRAGRPPTLHRR